MDYPWRPRLPNANFCPVCSHPHFPFCSPPPPPPPPPLYFRPPPPPPDQFFHVRQPPPQPPYDPFVDHQSGPPANPYPPPPPTAGQVPPRPWSGNPNFGNNFYGNTYDHNVQVGTKRMRFDNASDTSGSSLSEDERRLKLIRDHGATTHGLDQDSNHSVEPGNFGGKTATFGINQQINPNYSDGSMAQGNISGNNVHGSDGHKNYNQPGGIHGALQYDNGGYQDQSRGFPVGSKSGYCSIPNYGDNVHPVHGSPGFRSQSPLPHNPPPLMPSEPPRFRFPHSGVSIPGSGPGSLFPISVDPSSTFQRPVVVSDPSQSTPNSSSYYSQEIQSMKIAPSKTFKGEHEVFPPKHPPLDKPKLIDVSYILKHPHRATRPDYLVIILRGLPGSGKSYLAKILRDLEVENGGTAPRIHSMDEYFMTEVEKVEESEGSKSSGSSRGKRPTMKRVMEYCYEPEMEEAYRSSMLKAFKKTLDDGTFPFVIVDDRNLRVADFAQFWATAKRSGYEVYLLEATYKDPAGCAARNVHGFTQNDIQDMADQWEEAPSMYMKLDIKSLLHGDDLEENGIREVDMDTDDGNDVGDPSGSEDVKHEKVIEPLELDSSSNDRLKDEPNGGAVDTHPVEEVKELGKSKWSNDLDEDNADETEATIENPSSLSNLMKSYSKKGKSVRWADKVGSSIGFSIGSGRPGIVSLIIGSGSGYNSKTNPLSEDEKLGQRCGEPRKQTMFQEQLRAEGEALKGIFDQRRHKRIGVLDGDGE